MLECFLFLGQNGKRISLEGEELYSGSGFMWPVAFGPVVAKYSMVGGRKSISSEPPRPSPQPKRDLFAQQRVGNKRPLER